MADAAGERAKYPRPPRQLNAYSAYSIRSTPIAYSGFAKQRLAS
ncbi:hypothetical protein [Streptomyces sp. NPDC057403]